MPSLNLPALARRQGKRRAITLRDPAPTKALATGLAAILVRAATHWREAAPAILAGYDPAPLAADALTLDSPAQVQTAIDLTASDFITRVFVDITAALKRWAVRSEQVHRGKWIAAVKAGADVDLSTVLTSLGTGETIEAFVNRNAALAKNISDQAQQRIADAVWRGYQQRQPVSAVAKEIREAADLGRARARRIAADQNVKLWAALDMERHVEAGIEQVKWRHSGKLHYRPWHRERDGKVFDLLSRKAVDGSETVPADDWAGQPPWCGCRASAYLPIMDEIG